MTTMTRVILSIVLSILGQTAFSQVYIEKQSRHRFAQMTLGLDVQSSLGGYTNLPNRIQNWILRINLRWFPNLYLEVEPYSKISFDNLDFNFIQLIICPNRVTK